MDFPVGSGVLSYWRSLFLSSGADVFEVINRAIDVAAADRPDELRARRDRIAERLFTLSSADRMRPVSGIEEDEKEEKGDRSVRGSAVVVGKESNYSYDEAEALTDEIDQESIITEEVIRIRDILYNMNQESESMLFQSLRRLQLLSLSVETLKATEIGRAVNGLRKHKSKEIRHLVRTLIDGWKALVDKWVYTANAIADNSPESVNPSSTIEDEGLPSPPLDEGAFLASYTTTIQLSGFFDGMDEDGNPSEMVQNMENARPSGNHKPEKKQQHVANPGARVQNTQQIKSHDTSVEQSKPLTRCGSARPSREISEQKPTSVMKFNQPNGPSSSQRKPAVMVPDKSADLDDTSVLAKFEVAKRKLQERYQEAENAKKQRTIQVMELHDIPKQGNNFRQTKQNPKNRSRNNVRM